MHLRFGIFPLHIGLTMDDGVMFCFHLLVVSVRSFSARKTIDMC